MMQGARKRRIPVIEIDLLDVSKMWEYEYQAKHINKEGELDCVLASNSIRKFKKEVKSRRWDTAWITTSKGRLSYGQELVDEYPYMPRYKQM